MNYIKQLDSIRTFAVICVIIYHWGDKFTIELFPSIGNLGVSIFFVLSGFLITSILLIEKEKIEENSSIKLKFSAIGNFMMRRILRIFPIFYLMLIILYFGEKILPNPIPKDWNYYFLYLHNFLIYFRHQWPGGKVGPFWTLAVEEQFYLIWPWFIFFVKKKFIKLIIIISILLGIISTYFLSLNPLSGQYSQVLTICCIHSFCIGALLSYFSIYKYHILEKYYSTLKTISIITLVFYVYIIFINQSLLFLERLLESMITMFLIYSILLNKTQKIDFILSNRILISIGKVSYGIYLFHNFIPIILKGLIHFIKKKIISNNNIILYLDSFQSNHIVFNLFCFCILIMLSLFSFYYFEKPILKLKKYF